jgi:hypothetical protein
LVRARVRAALAPLLATAYAFVAAIGKIAGTVTVIQTIYALARVAVA